MKFFWQSSITEHFINCFNLCIWKALGHRTLLSCVTLSVLLLCFLVLTIRHSLVPSYHRVLNKRFLKRSQYTTAYTLHMGETYASHQIYWNENSQESDRLYNVYSKANEWMRQVQNAFLRTDIHTSLIVDASSLHFFHVKKCFQPYQLSTRHASSMTLIQTKTKERHSPLGIEFYELLSLISGFEKPTNKKEGRNPVSLC